MKIANRDVATPIEIRTIIKMGRLVVGRRSMNGKSMKGVVIAASPAT